jgi:tetratricopeptide (TPR) repeat protein
MHMIAALQTGFRRGLAALFLLALLGLGAARANELQEANTLLKAGQHREALARVNKVLAAKPKDAQARFLKGVILTEQGATREAIDIFTRLTRDFPELPEPYNNLAVIYAAQGQYERARVTLEQSIRTHPSYATAYENLGDVYAKLASQAYDKALQLDKSNTGAQNKLSLVREISSGPAAVLTKEPAVVAKAEPKPAPASDPSAEVLKAVNGWAEAWSKRDVDAYLGYYSKDFQTPRGEPRAAWEKTRRSRIDAAKIITVEVSSPKVTMNGANEATVRFRQAYRSDRFKATGNKTLVLTRNAEGRWQIRQEKSG